MRQVMNTASKPATGVMYVCLALAIVSALPTVARSQPEGTVNAVDTHLAALLSDDPESHERALLDLVELGEPAAPRLEEIAVNIQLPSRVRSGAVFALGRITAPSSQTVLDGLWAQGFESLGGALAVQIAIALGEYGSFTALEEMVGTGDDVLGAKAAIQLGLHRSASSLELLQSAYGSEQYARLRIFFAIALGLLGDEQGRELLASAITTPELRNHCAIALAGIGSGADVNFELVFAMTDVDPLVRLRALEALIELGRSDLDEILVEASNDVDRRVRGEAEQALRRLRRRDRRRH